MKLKAATRNAVHPRDPKYRAGDMIAGSRKLSPAMASRIRSKANRILGDKDSAAGAAT